MANSRAGSTRSRPTCSTIAGARPSSCSAASASPSRSMARPTRKSASSPSTSSRASCRAANGSCSQRPRAARQGAQRSSSRTSTARARSCRAGIVPADLVFRNPDFRPEMTGQKRAARHLRAHRRHRHRARRRRRLLRARGQCPHALRRLLHAGEPRGHDAAVPGSVRAPSRRAGRELSRRTAGDAEIGGAALRHARSDRRAADARRLQLGLLRALVPRRQARHRAGRGPRPASSRTTSSTCARPRARSAST